MRQSDIPLDSALPSRLLLKRQMRAHALQCSFWKTEDDWLLAKQRIGRIVEAKALEGEIVVTLGAGEMGLPYFTPNRWDSIAVLFMLSELGFSSADIIDGFGAVQLELRLDLFTGDAFPWE